MLQYEHMSWDPVIKKAEWSALPAGSILISSQAADERFKSTCHLKTGIKYSLLRVGPQAPQA